MRAIERMTIKKGHRLGLGRWGFPFFPLDGAHLLKSRCFLLFCKETATVRLQHQSSKQISPMDMYGNLGDDWAILWALNSPHHNNVN